MKKRIAVLFGTALLAGMMTACGGDTAETTAAATTAAETAAETEAAAEETEAAAEETEAAAEIVAPAEDVAMQYISIEDAKADIGADGYTFFDVRKAADYETGHIPGAVSADMDAAKEGDFEAGVATMQAATDGLDDNLVIICYSGKKYAQATTNVLSAIGYDMSKVYTLEGGMTAWSETYPDDVETGAPAAEEAAAEIVAPAEDVAMQYVSAEDAAGLLNTEGTTIFDVRKAEDYAAGHIPGAVSVDMDAAKEGDFEAGVANMQPAVEGLNDDLILVCYSGKRYAQAATNVLSALGYDMSKVYTLEGGMEAWNEAQPDNLETAE